jgi:hypothetical protein
MRIRFVPVNRIRAVCASEMLVAGVTIACHGSVSRAIAESALQRGFQPDRGIAAAAWNRTAPFVIPPTFEMHTHSPARRLAHLTFGPAPAIMPAAQFMHRTLE